MNGGSIPKQRNVEVGLLARNPLGHGLFFPLAALPLVHVAMLHFSHGVLPDKKSRTRSRAGFLEVPASSAELKSLL